MLAEILIQEVRDQLHDATPPDVRWLLDEKIRALNFAQKMVVEIRPDASTQNESVKLTAGGTKQTIPASGVRFFKLTRNMGVAGTTPGKAISLVDFDALTLEDEDWHTADVATVMQHYLYDNLNPLNFYVYPPVHASTAVFVEIIYSKLPTDVPLSATYDALTDVIGLPDIYEPAIVDFMLSRLYLKSEEAGDLQAATTHFAMAVRQLGVKTMKDNLTQPPVREGAHATPPPRPESVSV